MGWCGGRLAGREIEIGTYLLDSGFVGISGYMLKRA